MPLSIQLLENHSGVCGIVGDRTGVLSVGEADEAGLSPSSTPRVSDLPVRGSIHSDGLHAMVNTGSAHRQDAASVTVPVVRVNADGKRTGCLHVRRHVTLRTANKRRQKIYQSFQLQRLITGLT